MQYILSEEEFKRGFPLFEAWTTREMTLSCAYDEQENLNSQGFYTVINEIDIKNDRYKITVYQK